MAQGPHIHAYQPTTPCCLPRTDNQKTIIFADASGTASLMLAAGRAALELRPETAGWLGQHLLTGTTIFGASPHGELKTLAFIMNAINTTHGHPQGDTHHVWVVVIAPVDYQIIARLARQPLHKATDSSLGTQALHLWAALRSLPRHVILHLVKQESHCYTLGNGHIDLHTHNQLAEDMPDNGEPPLRDHMHAHLQHLPLVPHPGELPAWVPDNVIMNE